MLKETFSSIQKRIDDLETNFKAAVEEAVSRKLLVLEKAIAHAAIENKEVKVEVEELKNGMIDVKKNQEKQTQNVNQISRDTLSNLQAIKHLRVKMKESNEDDVEQKEENEEKKEQDEKEKTLLEQLKEARNEIARLEEALMKKTTDLLSQ